MSNLDDNPGVTRLAPGEPCTGVEILDPRLVPLGGLRAMTVYRTLPQRKRSLVGAWCFLDHYGPDDVAASGGMEVPRHPHTGLATVSWLFTGRVDHLDSGGSAAGVLPGELNLMIAGRGITHQEISSADTRTLHGVQLWYALPEATRHSENHFAHYVPPPVQIAGEQASGDSTAGAAGAAGAVGDAAGNVPGATACVFIGALAGATSPVDTRTPDLLGAELVLEPGAMIRIHARRDFEHAVLAENARVLVNGTAAEHRELAYVPVGADALTIEAGPAGGRVMLLGGVPLGEEIVMWWNFIGRDHNEIVEFRRRYQAEMGFEAPDPQDTTKAPLFGEFPPGQRPPLPAPPLPIARLKPRA